MNTLDAARGALTTESVENSVVPGAWASPEWPTNGQATDVVETSIDQRSVSLFWASLQALDYLGIGWIVCDASSRVLGANRTADTIIRNRDGLELRSDGVLRTLNGENQFLSQALKLATEPTIFGKSRKPDITLAVQRQSGKRPLTLFVRSVQGGPTQEGSVHPVALVLITDSALYSTTHEDLYQLYRLTSKEARLAILLMEGRALKDCCCELSITLSTGLSHLHRIFKKVGVRSQSELVMVLVKSIGLARLGDRG